MDNKISFIGGFIVTTIASFDPAKIFEVSVLGLCGGFFGLLGKQIFYFAKRKVYEIFSNK